jgi:hypothetical protein
MPAYCSAAACTRHVDVEDPGEGGLGREESEEGAQAGAQHVLGRGVLGHRAGGGDDLPGEQLPAFGGRGQEAVVLALEMLVERGP